MRFRLGTSQNPPPKAEGKAEHSKACPSQCDQAPSGGMLGLFWPTPLVGLLWKECRVLPSRAAGMMHHKNARHCAPQRESSTRHGDQEQKGPYSPPKALLPLGAPYLNRRKVSALHFLIFLINQFRYLCTSVVTQTFQPAD